MIVSGAVFPDPVREGVAKNPNNGYRTLGLPPHIAIYRRLR